MNYDLKHTTTNEKLRVTVIPHHGFWAKPKIRDAESSSRYAKHSETPILK
jgi:hypothetical protein